MNNSLSYAKDQSGCRMLQAQLDKENPEFTAKLFEKLEEKEEYFQELIMDPFGNYFIQKLSQKCTVEQFKALVDIISKGQGDEKGIPEICKNQHGTRAL